MSNKKVRKNVDKKVESQSVKIDDSYRIVLSAEGGYHAMLTPDEWALLKSSITTGGLQRLPENCSLAQKIMPIFANGDHAHFSIDILPIAQMMRIVDPKNINIPGWHRIDS